MQELEQQIFKEWLDHGKIWDALGWAYSELGRYEYAIDRYKRAIATSGASIRSIEQLANLEKREAERLIENHELQEQEQEEVRKRLKEEGKERLENLIAIAPSAERYSLLGATYKLLALLSYDPSEKSLETYLDYLNSSREAYQKAIACNPPDLYYPLENLIGIDLLLAKDSDLDRKGWRDKISDNIKQTKASAESSTDSWAKLTLVNAKLLGFLALGRGSAEEIAAAYEHALGPKSSTSAREQDSVIRQVRMYANYAQAKTVRNMAGDVIKLIDSSI